MNPTAAPAAPSAARLDRSRMVPSRRQLLLVVLLSLVAAWALGFVAINPYIEVFGETLFVGMLLLFGFTLAGAWRQTLLPRWVAQMLAVALGAALGPLIVQLLSVGGDFSRFVESHPMVRGYVLVTMSAAVIGTLFALGALYRERDAQLHSQALQFELERSGLERQALDARLSLLQAQIEPHFLFNTLANIQALVESGSPRASAVLESLIAYLRAAMPRLHDDQPTLGNELDLVRAYLELMQMRMPDRLRFAVRADPALHGERFPAMALLTLVENAIHHGIDPSEVGGRVEVGAERAAGGGLRIWVADSGVGLSPQSKPGTGLNNLRSRLEAVFGPQAELQLSEAVPHGLRVEMHLPAGS